MKDRKPRLCKEGEPLQGREVLDYVRSHDNRMDNPKTAIVFEMQKIVGNRLYPHVKKCGIKGTRGSFAVSLLGTDSLMQQKKILV